MTADLTARGLPTLFPQKLVQHRNEFLGCLRFTHNDGRVRVGHRDETGVLLYVYGRGSARAYMTLLYVVDASSGRPSLLRVPPRMKHASEAVAWTFGMEEREWDPLLEV
jgi:hypothetical protein